MSRKKTFELLRKARVWVNENYICCRKYSGCQHNDELCPVWQIDQALIKLKTLPAENEELKSWQGYERWKETETENKRLKAFMDWLIEDLKVWLCFVHDECEQRNIERFIRDIEQALESK